MGRDKDKPVKREFDYMALDDGAFEFGWTNAELKQFRELWDEGVNIWAIANKMRRDVDEVGVLLIDQVRQKKVFKRKGGAYGNYYTKGRT